MFILKRDLFTHTNTIISRPTRSFRALISVAHSHAQTLEVDSKKHPYMARQRTREHRPGHSSTSCGHEG